MFRAANWMGGLSLLLFWMPVAGPLVAGLVGGWKGRTPGNALLAVFVPAVLLAALTFAAVAWLADAFWGSLAAAGSLVLLLLNVVPLLLGALMGALAARFREAGEGHKR